MKWMDGHCDVLWRLGEDSEKSFYGRSGGLDVSYESLNRSQVKLQMFAIFVPPTVPLGHKLKTALKQIDLFYERVIGDGNQMVPITHMDQLQDLGEDQCGAMLVLEGADALEGDLANVRLLYRLGVRQIGLTWNWANEVADGVLEPRASGLTQFGREVLCEMQRQQMVIDVSHLAERGFWDVMEQANEHAILASHSNCQSLCPHVRNLTDKQIEAIIEHKGLIGINFVPYFISENTPSMEVIMDHIEHICQLGGENQLFFGSDFDGVEKKIPGLEHMGQLSSWKEALYQRFSKTQVQKWAWENGYRFYMEHL